MDKKNTNPKVTTKTRSRLDAITLSYEYDKTYREIIKLNKSRVQ